MTAVVVAGAVANKAGNAGAAWTRLSWAAGMAQLGFEVHLVEVLAAGTTPPPVAAEWFRRATASVGMQGRATLVGRDSSTLVGLAPDDLADLGAEVELLLNISGHLPRAHPVARSATRVFIDLDPGYTQLWHAQGTATLEPHDHWFTVGELVGTPACSVPTEGLAWRRIRQPVVLDHWPATGPGSPPRFTTVGSWRGPYGPVLHGGRWCGPKAHEFRRFADLPARVPDASLELALDIDDADDCDRRSLRSRGWRLIDPAQVAGTTEEFRRYVQGSSAEFSVAQGAYVRAMTGWFSDRTVRYLASGRPAVVQDTGFSRTLPTGHGLVTFEDLPGAARGIEAVMADLEGHGRAAARLAREAFAAPVVLGALCEEVGVAP